MFGSLGYESATGMQTFYHPERTIAKVAFRLAIPPFRDVVPKTPSCGGDTPLHRSARPKTAPPTLTSARTAFVSVLRWPSLTPPFAARIYCPTTAKPESVMATRSQTLGNDTDEMPIQLIVSTDAFRADLTLWSAQPSSRTIAERKC